MTGFVSRVLSWGHEREDPGKRLVYECHDCEMHRREMLMPVVLNKTKSMLVAK